MTPIKTKNMKLTTVRVAFENGYTGSADYLELLNWVFCKTYKIKEPNYWLNLWYEHFKDCPISGEFKHRLFKWFRSMGYDFHIEHNSNIDMYCTHNTFSAVKDYAVYGEILQDWDVAENLGILYVFQIIEVELGKKN